MIGFRAALMACGALALVSPTAANAQSSEGPQQSAAKDSQSSEAIVVTGQRVPDTIEGALGGATKIRDVPQGVSVVSRELFEVQQPNSLTDILRNTPSVSNFRNSSETFRTISLRGFVQNETIVDGLRNSDALNIQPDGLATIESVEVIRGPAAALYGRGSLGGTVNIVTKQPQDKFAALLSLDVGDPETVLGVVDVTGPLGGGASARLVYAYEDRDSFIDFTTVEGWHLAPSIAFRGARTEVVAQLDYREREQLRYVGLPAYGSVRGLNDLELPIGANFGEPGLPPTVNTGFQATVRVAHDLTDAWRFKGGLRYTDNTYDQQVAAPRTLGLDNRTLARSWNRFDEAQSETAVSGAFEGTAGWGGVTHALRFSADYADFSYDSKFFSGRLASINIANPVYGAVPTNTFLLDDTTDEISSFGLSVQDQITLSPSVRLLLGGRYDSIDTARLSNVTGNRGERTIEAFSPRVGVTYDVAPFATLYASWGRNIEAQNNGGSNARLQPFPEIEGEQYEAGVKLVDRDRVSATLSVYRIDATGVLTADLSDPNGFSIPTGERRSEGVELEVNWQPVQSLTLAGYATYTSAEIVKDSRLAAGTQIQNVPEQAGRLFALYEPLEGQALYGWSANAAVTYQGEQAGNLANSFRVPESTILDAGIAYSFQDFRIGLQVRNIADERHFIRGAFDGRNIVPGDPRIVLVSLSKRFGDDGR